MLPLYHHIEHGGLHRLKSLLTDEYMIWSSFFSCEIFNCTRWDENKFALLAKFVKSTFIRQLAGFTPRNIE